MPRVVSIVIDIGKRSLARFVELEGFDRAMALAGQIFAALLPLLIVYTSFSPGGGRDLSDSLIDRLHLTGIAASTLEASVKQPAELEDSINLAGVLILIVSALSFTRAMQRLYVRAWRLPKPGLGSNGWGLLWLCAFCLYWSLQPAILSVLSGTAAAVASIALSCGLWVMTPWILVGKRIPWTRLLPQALLTAVSLAVFGATSAIYMPRTVTTAAAQFGFIGVAFSLLSWLFVAALILVVAAALGAVLVEPLSHAESPRAGDVAAGVAHDDGT
jgi:membrane protein